MAGRYWQSVPAGRMPPSMEVKLGVRWTGAPGGASEAEGLSQPGLLAPAGGSHAFSLSDVPLLHRPKDQRAAELKSRFPGEVHEVIEGGTGTRPRIAATEQVVAKLET